MVSKNQRSKAVQVYVPSHPLCLLGSWGRLLCLPRDSYASIRGANGRSAGLPDSSKRGASSHSFFEALARFPARFHDAVFHDPSAKCSAVMTGFKNIRKQKTGSPSKRLPVLLLQFDRFFGLIETPLFHVPDLCHPVLVKFGLVADEQYSPFELF